MICLKENGDRDSAGTVETLGHLVWTVAVPLAAKALFFEPSHDKKLGLLTPSPKSSDSAPQPKMSHFLTSLKTFSKDIVICLKENDRSGVRTGDHINPGFFSLGRRRPKWLRHVPP